MTKAELEKLISRGETLTVEFKSDRDKLPDRALVEAVVAMTNTEGGILLEGVEDGTGEITGLHRSHIGCGTPEALIANKTVPPVQVTVDEVAAEIQRKAVTAQTLLDDMIKWGDVVAVEKERGVRYMLSPKTEQSLRGQSVPDRMDDSVYVKYKTIVKTILRQKGSIKREDVAVQCGVDARKAGYILKKMLECGEIIRIGERRWAIYKLPDSMNN